MTIQPFPMIELAIKELIEAKYPAAEGKVGGDLSYKRGDGLYVHVALVGGAGDDRFGTWVVDIDTFAATYSAAMGASLDLEAILLVRRHVTSIMRLDNTTQNEVPTERPWEDDSAFRVGATYVFTARRPG